MGFLTELERLSPEGLPPLDGEIALTRGSAVAWREFAAGAPQLLVKSHCGPALMSRSDILGSLLE